MESNINKPLNMKEAADFLDVSINYLRKLTSGKSITHYKPNGKKIFFLRSDLEKWLLRNKVESLSK